MSTVGYLIALLGLYVLYTGSIAFGGVIFFLGGFIAGRLFICLRSGGILTMIVSIAYGYHNEFTPTVLFLVFVGFVFKVLQSNKNKI